MESEEISTASSAYPNTTDTEPTETTMIPVPTPQASLIARLDLLVLYMESEEISTASSAYPNTTDTEPTETTMIPVPTPQVETY